MSILDRKPKKYDSSDLFWLPSPAPDDGIVGDVNTMKLDPSHLGMAQDVIIDTTGVLRNRGGFSSVTSDVFTTLSPIGAVQVSSGTALLLMDGTPNVNLYGTANANLTGFARLPISGVGTGSPQNLTTGDNWVPSITKLPNDLGAAFAFQRPYASPSGVPFLWGGNVAYTLLTTVGTMTVAIGAKAVVGVGTAWTTAMVGTYLYIASGAYLGQVDSVTSTTTLTLKKGAMAVAAASLPQFVSTRVPFVKIYKGKITTTTTSPIVVGSGTKFVSSAPGGSGGTYLVGANNYFVFRNADGAYIGTVTSVQNDTTLTLTGNAALSLANEDYYMINGAALGNTQGSEPFASFSASSVAQFANRYWWGCFSARDIIQKPAGGSGVLGANFFNGSLNAPNGVAFSKKDDPECLDFDPVAGDYIKLPTGNNPDYIRGMFATRGGLVVFRNFDTFLITGYSPETFRAIKIVDDGVFSSASFREYKDGVVWAGPKSIWFFDGTRVINLLQNKIQRFYRRTTRIQGQTNPNATAISNDHFMVSYSIGSGIDNQWPYKNTIKNIQTVTMVINMLNGAISFFTNLCVSGSFSAQALSATLIQPTVLLARNAANPVGATGYLLFSDTIFQDSFTAVDNVDQFTMNPTFTTGAQLGPDVMFETVKMSNGNAARMKFWKMLMMNYYTAVGMSCTILNESLPSLDFPNINVGTVTSNAFPTTLVNSSVLKRVKFLIRQPTLAIRIYQTSVPASNGTSQRFKLFWYAVGGKWMRWGRQS